tara:strand:- start:2945 stop:3499 length:555 start_codon:yes stop_codon:yes gene_type:complete
MALEINIDLELLVENEISADEYLALYCLYRQAFKTFESLTLSPDWEKLQTKSFVKLGPTPKEHIVRQEFIDLFSSDFDQMFNELLLKYPMKVNTRSGGTRILHASDPDCRANKRAKDRYRKVVVKKKHVHKRIMKLLDVQLEVDRDRLEFLQNLEVWINNHTWEKYANLENNAGDSKERITRRL